MKNVNRAALRLLIAKVICSEGCSCCEGSDHRALKDELAELLEVPRYADDSGFDWYSVRDGKG